MSAEKLRAVAEKASIDANKASSDKVVHNPVAPGKIKRKRDEEQWCSYLTGVIGVSESDRLYPSGKKPRPAGWPAV
jgi:hypothetical protein